MDIPTTTESGHSPVSRPLRIKVTEGGREVLVLRALVRRAIPMLTDPHGFRVEQRRHLAQNLARVLEGRRPDSDAAEAPPLPTDADLPQEPPEPEEYEPGCLKEDPWA